MVKKSARRTRRTHTPAFKALVALAALREDKTMGGVTSERSCNAWALRPWHPNRAPAKRAPGNKIYPCLLRKLPITRANQVWALDTTYIPMARGFVYLTAVVDVASRRVLAHKVAITLEACHAREVIDAAFARHGTPEIVNTDQGSQFMGVARYPLGHCRDVHRGGTGPGLQAVHGWARRVARQRVRRARVAQREVRAGVSEGLRQRQRRPRRHCRIPSLVQHGQAAFEFE